MHSQLRFVFSAALAAAAPVWAQDTMQSMPTVDAAALARAQGKFSQALDVVRHFDATAQREGFSNNEWRRELLANLMQADEATRTNVAAAGDLTEAMDRSRSAARIAPATPTNLIGSVTYDLVFIPITPCRILDTRAGASLKAGVTYSYSYDSGNTGAGSCGVHSQIPGLPAFSPAAEAVNVTVDENAFSGFAPGSYLAVFPQGGALGSSFMNFGPGQVLANAGVIALNAGNGQFSLLSNANTNVIVDVYGVFMPPQATALDCMETTKVTGNMDSYGTISLTGNTCPASYTAVGGSCFGGGNAYRSVEEAVMSANSQWVCRFHDSGGNTYPYELAASTRCCRVPGR